MSRTRRRPSRIVEISDAEYNQRIAEVEKEKERIAEETRKLIAQGEDIHALERKASQLGKEADVFRRQTPTPPKKGFFARFFGCLPCCGNDSVDDEKQPLLKHRK